MATAKKMDSLSTGRKPVLKHKKAVTKVEEEIPVAAMPEEENDYDTLFPEPTITLNRPPLWLIWVLLGITLLILLGTLYRITNGKLDRWLGLTPTPTVTEDPTASATSTPMPTATATSEPTTIPSATVPATAAPTPMPTATVAPAVTTKSAITLRVLNGTTISGAASKAASILEKNGFNVRTTGNAQQRTYGSTIIYYQAGRVGEAKSVQQALSGYQTSLQQSSLAYPDMVLVVIGLK